MQQPVPFTVEIRFYCYVGENQRTEFSTYFVNSMLNFLTPIGKETIPVKTQVKLRSGREAELEPAKGIHGVLLVSGAGDGYFLRVRLADWIRGTAKPHSEAAQRSRTAKPPGAACMSDSFWLPGICMTP